MNRRMLADFSNAISSQIAEDLDSATFFQLLDGAKQQQLLGILVQQEISLFQLAAIAAQQGSAPSMDEVYRIRVETDSEIQSMLTPKEFVDFNGHRESAPDRLILAATENELGTELAEEKARLLTEALAQERTTMMNNSVAAGIPPSSAIAGMKQRIQERVSALPMLPEERLAVSNALGRILPAAPEIQRR